MIFRETSIFTKLLFSFISDEDYRRLQSVLIRNPHAGSVIPGGGGLRKLRLAAKKRGKGKRSGLRLIYWAVSTHLIYMAFMYDKDKHEDLTKEQMRMLQIYVKGKLI